MAYWRIRARDAGSVDRSAEMWDRAEVGVWYGAWTADDWQQAQTQANPLEHLNQLPTQAALWPMQQQYIDTVRRFAAISETDWVITYHGGALHFGRVEGPLQSNGGHPLNNHGEIFKFRRLRPGTTKSFRLNHLPDSYRLVPSAGRGNVHEFHGARALVEVLGESPTEEAAVAAIQAMPPMDWLDLLGPSGWESFCLGYLIITEGFRPTGLVAGRTLQELDIVGRNAEGLRILAQCKKNPRGAPVEIPAEFIDALEDVRHAARIYFFAYGDCQTPPPDWVRVITASDVEKWIETDAGRHYMNLWRQPSR
jgi:hypothetical protein